MRTGVLEAIEWTGTPDDGQIRAKIDEALASEEQVRRMPAKTRIRLGRDLFDSLRRFDAITELLEDGSVSEITCLQANILTAIRIGMQPMSGIIVKNCVSRTAKDSVRRTSCVRISACMIRKHMRSSCSIVRI